MKMTNKRNLKFKNIDIARFDVDRVIYLLKSLTAIFNQENDLLDKMNLNAFSSIYLSKIDLLEEFEIHQNIIALKPEFIRNLNTDRLKILRTVFADFEKAKELNKKNLNIAVAVNKQIIDMITKLVSNQVESKNGYSKNGDYQAKEFIEKIMPPFAFNSVI